MRTLIRNAILALALSAGMVPAFAQVPSPVPALPDAERRTSYSISGTTCACSVGFALYGDSTDFSSWVEVFLNGVRVNFNDSTFGWTLTTPSGSFASLARPITNAVLTFNSVQTGTVQIVGARRPRRTTQFQENVGVPARNLNLAFSDLTTQTRELWDKTNDVTGRAILGLPGESIAPLPSATARKSSVICWDATGLIPMACAALNGLGNVVGPNSAVDGHIAVFSGVTGMIVRDGGLVGAGNVTGPASSTDGAFALYNGTLGTTIKNGPTIIPLASGGTAAALTASNGGLIYSTGAALAILSGTATANQIAMSGSSAAPAWSTATYPATTTVNQLLWSSGTNAIAGLATANNGVLITSGAGVPSISSTLPAAVQANITALGTITSGVWNGTLIATGSGGTGCSSASGTCLDNITGFASTGYVKRTGAGTYAFNGTIPLADGGSNASLSASSGGLVYSTASAFAVLSGTGTPGQIPLSGTNSAPGWSTTTWPNTISVNNLLWSSGSNAVVGLATANNGVLVTSGAGVPSISSTLPTAVQSNITQLGTIGAGVWNGTAITGAFIATNTVTNTNLAQSGVGATLKGNPTSSGANQQDFTIQGLINKPSPSANNDFVVLYDASTGTLKSVTPGQLTSGGVAGVSSLNGLTGGLSIVAGTGLNVAAAGASITVSPDSSYLRGYISGLTLSNDGVTPNTIIDIAAGVATSDDATTPMKIAAFTKNMNAAWAVGSTNGCADGAASYTTLGATTWYHLFLIERTDTGVVDILCSKSATAPTLPGSYTKQRRLGAIKTDGSSHILAFSQNGTEFLWSVPTADLNISNPATSPGTLSAINVPTGVQISAICTFVIQNTAAVRIALLVTSPDQADTAPVAGTIMTVMTGLGATAGVQMTQIRVRTNTSAQVRTRVDVTSATVNIFETTFGWIDNL